MRVKYLDNVGDYLSNVVCVVARRKGTSSCLGVGLVDGADELVDERLGLCAVSGSVRLDVLYEKGGQRTVRCHVKSQRERGLRSWDVMLLTELWRLLTTVCGETARFSASTTLADANRPSDRKAKRKDATRANNIVQSWMR